MHADARTCTCTDTEKDIKSYVAVITKEIVKCVKL